MLNGRRRWTAIAAAAAFVITGSSPAIAQAAAATTVVDTRDELLAALSSATAGDTVFVDGAAQIDLTGHKRIAIPAGVTLASNRGENGSLGARLYNTESIVLKETWPQFTVTGSGTRIIGLRLQGPDQLIRDDPYEYSNSDGISASDASDLLIENNEMFGWSHAAVAVRNTLEVRVRGNNIHHNRRTGLGYGVMVHDHSSAVIEDNTFAHNRHSIAGTGYRTERYEARFNVVTAAPQSHAFDMHGENEEYANGEPWAGDVLHVKNNSFRTADYQAFVVRGRPFTGAVVSGNCFAHASSATAVAQTKFTGNLTIGANTYGTTTGNCHQTGRRVQWQLSAGGTSSWAPIAPYTFSVGEVGFGDFNGDGKTDVFRATGHRWYYSPGGTGPWVPLALSGDQLADLRFGDFNGDGTTDVFKADGTTWRYSPGGASSWVTLTSSGFTNDALRFGDFNGDGRTDVFRANGTQWFYSSGGNSSWTGLALSGTGVASLRFGDFNGDNKTDVFSVSGSQWRYSPGGASSYVNLATASDPLTSLRFADFNGDNKTDVFSISSTNQWRYSSGGATSWLNLASSGCPLGSLHVADDFTGDNKADVFDGRCGG
ncbi:FG-GAP-like repeat-containing protein [Actinoplanes sp. NPDC024001]|uniref:FG-GAP-like repeat-containing protein n=1 Tax=Actinoplanes sp. NPDC024001 TaxID=3154598 RepID=UPI0033F62EDC